MIVRGLAPSSDRRRRAAAARLAQHQPRLDHAPVLVDLQGEGGVGRRVRADRQAAAVAERDRARAGAPRAHREADVAPLPHRLGVDEPGGGQQQRHRRVAAVPNGSRRLSSSASPRPSSSPLTTASTRSTGIRSSARRTPRACSTKAFANASRRPRSTSTPAAARCPPWRVRCSAHAFSPPSRSNAGMLRPEPRPRWPSSATHTTGRLWRSAMRAATIPITPACQPSPDST